MTGPAGPEEELPSADEEDVSPVEDDVPGAKLEGRTSDELDSPPFDDDKRGADDGGAMLVADHEDDDGGAMLVADHEDDDGGAMLVADHEDDGTASEAEEAPALLLDPARDELGVSGALDPVVTAEELPSSPSDELEDSPPVLEDELEDDPPSGTQAAARSNNHDDVRRLLGIPTPP
jgi:hypothetical protein